MALHADAPPLKRHTFHLEPQTLLGRMLAGHANRAARSDHAMPRQIAKHAQRPRDLPRSVGKTGRRGNLSVARDLPARNPADYFRESD